MCNRIIIAGAGGVALTALSLLYGYSGIDSEFRGAPLAFLQIDNAISIGSRYTLHYKELLMNMLVYSLPVWLVLQIVKSKGS